jgi:DNA polymerase III delta subunit
MLKVFYGPNIFARNLEVAKLKAEFIKRDGQYAVRTLSAEDLSVKKFLEDASNNGLFAKSELIIVRNGEDNLELISAALELPDSELKTIVLLVGNLDKRTSQYKKISKNPGFKEFKNLSELELKKWISSVAKKLNLNLDSKTIQELLQRTESNQQEIWICLNQLSLLGRQEIKLADLDIFLAPSSTQNAFNLLESALKGDSKKFQTTLKELQQFKEDPYRTIGLLCSQAHSLFALTLGIQNSKTPSQIATENGFHPFVASQQVKLVGSLNLTKQKLSKVIESLSWLDLSLKTVNKTEPWPMLDATLRKISML